MNEFSLNKAAESDSSLIVNSMQTAAHSVVMSHLNGRVLWIVYPQKMTGGDQPLSTVAFSPEGRRLKSLHRWSSSPSGGAHLAAMLFLKMIHRCLSNKRINNRK